MRNDARKSCRTRSLRAERNKRLGADCGVTALVCAVLGACLIREGWMGWLWYACLGMGPGLTLLFMRWMEAYDHFTARLREILICVVLSNVYAFGLGCAAGFGLFRSRMLLALQGAGFCLQMAGMLLCNGGLYRRFHHSGIYRNPSLLVVAAQGCEARLRRLKYGVLSDFDAWYMVIGQPGQEGPPELWERLERSDALCIFDNVWGPVYDRLMDCAMKAGKEVYTIPRMTETNVNHSCLTHFDDIPVLYRNDCRLSLGQRFWKRTLDLTVALAALAAAALPMAVIALWIRLDSPGPVIYRQERYTRDKRTFRIMKFRTMAADAEKQTGPVFARKNDPRVTRAGKVLRRFRLDELPQIFNILKGEMSLVGPRPERPFFVEKFEKEVPQYDSRFAVKAGLTALSHVYGRYSTYICDRTYYDLRYIVNYSFLLDIRILLLTSKTLFIPNAAEGEDEFKTKPITQTGSR